MSEGLLTACEEKILTFVPTLGTFDAKVNNDIIFHPSVAEPFPILPSRESRRVFEKPITIVQELYPPFLIRNKKINPTVRIAKLGEGQNTTLYMSSTSTVELRPKLCFGRRLG